MTRFAAIAIMTGAALLAQGPGPRGERRGTPPDPQTMIQMRISFLATALTLTEDQKTKATSIFTEAHAASQNARTSMEAARTALGTAVKSNNTAAIDQAATTIGSLLGQLTAIDSKADAAFYALLTAEQKAKFDEMPRRGGGPGGPMGGRMGPPPAR